MCRIFNIVLKFPDKIAWVCLAIVFRWPRQYFYRIRDDPTLHACDGKNQLGFSFDSNDKCLVLSKVPGNFLLAQ